MAHLVEVAKSGRATCRGCGEKVEKGALRFGEEVPNVFAEEGGTAHRYWHLPCAAKKMANELREALRSFAEEVPDRAALDALITEHAHPDYPYAERAPNGRARCRVCQEGIGKGQLRVVFERVYETGMGMTRSAGYLHAACTMRYGDAEKLGKEALDAALRAHSALPAADLEEITRALG